MRVELISDSHVPDTVRDLPMAEIRKAFRGVDMVLYAGDMYVTSLLDEPATIAPVLASSGDDDSVCPGEGFPELLQLQFTKPFRRHGL